jgi:hypothetical protein
VLWPAIASTPLRLPPLRPRATIPAERCECADAGTGAGGGKGRRRCGETCINRVGRVECVGDCNAVAALAAQIGVDLTAPWFDPRSLSKPQRAAYEDAKAAAAASNCGVGPGCGNRALQSPGKALRVIETPGKGWGVVADEHIPHGQAG